MSFGYLFELNGVELQDVSIGSSIIEKLEEPLDEGSMRLPFTLRNYEYEMLGYLKITSQDKNLVRKVFEFIIISDDVSEGSKYGDFIHEITVIEYSHKYDKYLVHSLTKTKSIKDENLAKFLYNQQMYLNSGSLTAYTMRVWIPPIDVVSSYYSDEYITFEKVDNAIQAVNFQTNNLYTYNDNIDVYLKINNTRFLLSSSNASIKLPAGDYEFEYGFTAVANNFSLPTGDTWLYKFQVRVFDREKISVYDALDLIRNTVSRFGGIESKRYFDKTRLFNIDPNIEGYLKSIEVPQTYIQKATLRQVLNSIFVYVNAISRVYNDVENETDILSMDEFNKISGSFTKSDIAGYHSSQESNQLGSKGVSWLERVLPDNRERANITEPSGNNFKTVRSNNIQITEDKFGLELSIPIYEPKSFETFLSGLYIYNISGSEFFKYEDYVINLTPRLLNVEEWKIKENTTNFPISEVQPIFTSNVGLRENKVGNIYWERNSTYLNLSDVFGEAYSKTLIESVIQEAINEQITRNPPYPLFDSVNGYMITSYTLKFDGYNKSGIFSNNLNNFSDLFWAYYKFNLEYITQQNTTIEVEREDISYLDYYSEIRQNQSDKLINVELASRKSYGEIQRSGVPNKTFQKFHQDFSNVYGIGFEDEDGYVITKRKLEFQNNYILATYNATKDHNRLSQYIGVEQEYRWSEIPTTSQVFERIEPYRDYVYITKPNVLLVEEATKISRDLTLKLLFANLINDWHGITTNGKTKITTAYIRTDKFLEEYPDSTYKYAISIPVDSSAKKSGLRFQFGFKSNQIALSAVEKVGGNRYNKAIKYTDDLGVMNELWFQLSREYSLQPSDTGWDEKETLDNYPLVRTNKETSSGGALFGSINDVSFDSGSSNPLLPEYDALMVFKDKAQNINIPYQLNVLAHEYKTYVIGQDFYTENLLVENPNVDSSGNIVGNDMYIYIYDTYTPYGILDDLKIKSGWNDKIKLISGTNVLIDETERTFRFTGSVSNFIDFASNWAIGDNRGNLYLASNGNYNGFNFFKTHFRRDLLEIGNREIPNPPLAFSQKIQIISTVYAETSNISGVVIDLEATFDSDVNTTLGQDEYQEFHTSSQVYAETQSVVGVIIDLEANINSDVVETLGQDEYGNIYITSNVLAEMTKVTGVIVPLEANINSDVVETLGQYEYGNIYITSNVLAEMTKVTGVIVPLEANVDSLVNDTTSGVQIAYRWVYGGSQETIGQACAGLTDLGNVKKETTSYTSCGWVTISNLYFSATDLTTNPSCGQGVEKTTCSFRSELGNYSCIDYEGKVTTTTDDTYYTCQAVEEEL